MPKKSNYEVVRTALGTKTADAILGMITDEVNNLRAEVSGLIDRQVEVAEVAEADGSSEAVKASNEGARAVIAADKAVEQAESDPTTEKAQEAAEAVEVAKDKVEQAESDLGLRVDAVEETLAPWRKGEKIGDRKPSRFDPIEQDMTRLSGQVDQAEARYNEAAAMVRASRGPALWMVALVTFVVAFVIAGVVAIFTSLTIFWDAAWLAIATTAFVTIVTWILEDAIPKYGTSKKSQSRAESSKNSEGEGLSIMQDTRSAH